MEDSIAWAISHATEHAPALAHAAMADIPVNPFSGNEAALAQLDQAINALQEPTEKPTQQPIEPQKNLQSRLDDLNLEIDKAVDSGNNAEVVRLEDEWKKLVRDERAYRERELANAEDYFDAVMKEEGESAEEKSRSAKEVEDWKKSLQGLDEYIAEQGVYFDEVFAGMHEHEVEAKKPSYAEKLAALQKEFDERFAQLVAEVPIGNAAIEAQVAKIKAGADIPLSHE